MLFNYNSYSLKPGIYEIKNLLSGKSYIGSAKRFKSRWQNHASSLKTGKHQCKHLRNSFNKYFEEQKKDDFIEFHVLEVMENSTKEERLIREEFWINKFKSDGVEIYNSRLKPTDEPKNRSCTSLTPEETSKKMSESLKAFYAIPENRQKQSELLKGKPKPQRTKEHNQKLGLAHIGIKPTKETKEKMSKAHKTEANLNKLKETYEKHREHIIAEQSDAVAKIHILVQPDGTIIKVKNLNKFCKEKNMHSSGFSNLLRKSDSSATYKGWQYLGSSVEQ